MDDANLKRIDFVEHYARESADALRAFFEGNASRVVAVADALSDCLRGGGKILLFGNGGSAADAQHLAAEFAGRYLKDRAPLAAVALTTDSSNLTAISNDFGFDRVFERQVRALAREGDAAIGISTSGTSPNVIKALEAARDLKAVTIGFAGRDGGKMATCCDHLFIVEHQSTPIIQQAQITLGHVLCHLVEEALFP
jgi:D-sedoheptulose 7-phosphate isomerase